MADMNSATTTVVNIAQSLLAIEQATGAITPQVISDKVDVASGIVSGATLSLNLLGSFSNAGASAATSERMPKRITRCRRCGIP